MKVSRFFLFSVLLSLGAVFTFAQEQSIEQKALDPRERIMLTTIQEDAKSDNVLRKQDALNSIKANYINKKKFTPEVQKILRDLCSEGIRDQVRTGGVVTNKLPEIRKQAIQYLGEFNFTNADPEVAKAAEETLKTVAQDENYPDNVADAFISLSKIAVTDPQPESAKKVVDTIDFVFAEFDGMATPQTGSISAASGDDRLASYYIRAIVNMATNGTLKSDSDTFLISIQYLQRIASGGGNSYNQKQKYNSRTMSDANKAIQTLRALAASNN